MRTITSHASATFIPQSDSQTPFPCAIACCPASFERCMRRVLELLQAYRDEFHKPSESDLPPACQAFISAARASLRRAAAAAPRRQDDWADDCFDGDLGVMQASRFNVMLDRSISARKERQADDLRSAIDALGMATLLVKKVRWSRLSNLTRALDYVHLHWLVEEINSSRKVWNDTNLNNLV